MTTTCARTDCTNPATHTPVLEVSPDAANYASARLEQSVCEHHALTLGADEFLSDTGWARLVAGFQLKGLAVPLKKHTRVRFEELP